MPIAACIEIADDRCMHALAFTGPADDAGATTILELPVPPPGRGQVSISVAAAGINFIDVMARRGDPGYVTRWPFVPGLEVAGVVQAVGASVDGLRPGQAVAAFTGGGGLAEVVVTTAEFVARLPPSLDPAIAAAAPTVLTTAILLIENAARVRANDVVLVHSAAGGLGRALAQLARQKGAARVLGVVGSSERIPHALDAGYDEVFTRDANLVDAVRAALGRGAVDAFIDTQGTSQLENDLLLAAPGARIVLIGNAAGGPLGPLPEAKRLFAGNVSIGGFSVSGLSRAAPHVVGNALRSALNLLDAGAVNLAVETHQGLAAAAGIHNALARGATGKHVVRL